MKSKDLLLEASDHLNYEVWMLRLTSYRLAQVAESSPAENGPFLHTVTHTSHVEVSIYSSNAPITAPSEDEEHVARVNADIESFAIHLRALLDFFYMPPEKARSDDILAEHFFTDPQLWREARPQLSEQELAAIRERVGKEIAHLTYRRLFLTEPEKLWPFIDLKRTALDALEAFLENVDRSLLSERWRIQSA